MGIFALVPNDTCPLGICQGPGVVREQVFVFVDFDQISHGSKMLANPPCTYISAKIRNSFVERLTKHILRRSRGLRQSLDGHVLRAIFRPFAEEV